MPEGEIFQFAADFAHAEAVGDGRVDFQRLARDALAALGAEIAERPHVVQAVGQLDDDDADIVHHREQHLAIAFRLAILGGEEIDLAQFGDAIDAARDFIAKVLLDVGAGDGGVFDDVVQQSGLDADDVHPHAGEDPRHGERMAHVGLARRSLLSGMILRRELVGLLDGRQIVFGTRFPNGGDQLIEFALRVRGSWLNGDRRRYDTWVGSRRKGHTSILR